MIVQQRPDISVIVVNYFSEPELARCLRSLCRQPEAVEVIVADNGSETGARRQLRADYPLVMWRPMGGNSGFSAACNAAVEEASSSRLLFLNPDAIVLDGALTALTMALDAGSFAHAILGCAIRNDDGTVQLSCRRFPDWRTYFAGRFSLLTRLAPRNRWSANYLMSSFDHSSAGRVDWVSGAAMAMRRKTFELLRGFDTRFFLYFEDVDICRRAAELGIPTYFFPGASIQHQIGGSSKGVPCRALAYRHRSMWTYYRRWLHRPWLDPFAAVLIYGRLAALAFSQALVHLAGPAREVEFESQKPAGSGGAR